MNDLKLNYEVCDVPGKSGLTVSNYVLKAGSKFSKAQWKWGEDALSSAIESGRCKFIGDDKEVEKSDGEVSKNQKELEKLIEAYDKLDPESEKAEKLLSKINKLEAEI